MRIALCLGVWLVLSPCFVCVSRVLDGGSLVIVRSVLHLCVHVAHKGAKGLRSVFE